MFPVIPPSTRISESISTGDTSKEIADDALTARLRDWLLIEYGLPTTKLVAIALYLKIKLSKLRSKLIGAFKNNALR